MRCVPCSSSVRNKSHTAQVNFRRVVACELSMDDALIPMQSLAVGSKTFGSHEKPRACAKRRRHASCARALTACNPWAQVKFQHRRTATEVRRCKKAGRCGVTSLRRPVGFWGRCKLGGTISCSAGPSNWAPFRVSLPLQSPFQKLEVSSMTVDFCNAA